MRLSRYFLPVLKETPAEAQIVSHRLMLRAGMIKQASAGIYSWLPLGYKVLRNIERIVHEEQQRAGPRRGCRAVGGAGGRGPLGREREPIRARPARAGPPCHSRNASPRRSTCLRTKSGPPMRTASSPDRAGRVLRLFDAGC